MTFDRLHHMQLTIPLGQEQVARSFYVDTLGMTEIDKPPISPPAEGPGSGRAESSCTSE
jgi:catechol 2,3-dioxygenase-like lactoylglutathione lyase family enzyme